ncbi:hypothetical protein BJP41_04120 [Candidatus Williamhamiltonella defendens]|uniref:MobA/VirD2-like nuclease domain-containing protein n=1 Tax=Candidatus Williamhamiltonella defendens TaxID=138072 RepID=A0A2D3T1J7_9ENTR|nr:relaxase/mobilization nuclease domain-containing protein [Candidatus Hamiltonella defensa]ATW29667.1 hypothetical protein BJP41_04120 [Candidatus Hamiltonella defensa]ATW31645.1 hypothetical protein BJP42_04200 [Candidatus Hamiltonella defensa]
MIAGFSRYGKGGGKAPIDYLTAEDRLGRENAKPVTLRGDAELTCQLIDSLEFEYKYTSGVLSFAPNEQITPQQEQAIINRFEQVAFAVLQPDQYNILWVKHTHAGHHELHFVTPRVELSTGKSLNIKPPGKKTQQHFDDFRSEVNAKYGLADPTDPNRIRNVKIPNHTLKIASEAIRNGDKPLGDVHVMIDTIMSQRAIQGLIRCREDLVTQVKELGFEIPRTGSDYITVCEPESGKRWRLKGALYARDYSVSRTIEKSDSARERDYSKPDKAAAQRFTQRLEGHITARAEYHQNRYPQPERKYGMESIQKPNTLAVDHRIEPLTGYLQRQLANHELLRRADNSNAGVSQEIGSRRRKDSIQSVWGGSDAMHSDKQEKRGIRREKRLDDTGGILSDGTRKSLVEWIIKSGAEIYESTESLKRSAKRVAEDVSNYLSREHPITEAGKQLKQSTDGIEQALQNEQTLNSAIRHQQEQARAKKHAPYYGMSF